jgi:hypothetical protein
MMYVVKLTDYKMSVLSAILCRVPGTPVFQLTVVLVTLSYYIFIDFFLVHVLSFTSTCIVNYIIQIFDILHVTDFDSQNQDLKILKPCSYPLQPNGMEDKFRPMEGNESLNGRLHIFHSRSSNDKI